MKMKKAFTLAEVLITLAIIGVVAAISIPSVVANTQQKEFQTGLRKAVSVLNSAITMNIALDGESPYENKNLFGYLQRHMAIMESTYTLRGKYSSSGCGRGSDRDYFTNAAFYTTDGMRFEFNRYNTSCTPKVLYESGQSLCRGNFTTYDGYTNCGGCGSYGLTNNPDQTTKPPCLIAVDVNGDRKPNPANINCHGGTCSKPYKFSDPNGIKLTDIFTIMITDKQAIPYGVAAQRAMYQAQAKEK